MSSFYEPITVDTIARALNIEKNKYILQNIADLKNQKDILQKKSKELEKEIKIEAKSLGTALGLKYVGMGDVSVVYQDETTGKVFKILYNFNQKNSEIKSLNILKYIKQKNINRVVFPKNYVDDLTLIVEYPWCESLDNKLLNDDPILLDSMIDFNFKYLHATLQSLHDNGIYHKDIKIDNIGYCNNVLKLNDFGKAIKYNGNNNDFKKINAQSDFYDLLTAYIDSKKILKIDIDDENNTYKLLIESVSVDYKYDNKYSGGKRRNRRRRRRRTRRKRNTKQKKRSRRSKRSKKTT